MDYPTYFSTITSLRSELADSKAVASGVTLVVDTANTNVADSPLAKNTYT